MKSRKEKESAIERLRHVENELLSQSFEPFAKREAMKSTIKSSLARNPALLAKLASCKDQLDYVNLGNYVEELKKQIEETQFRTGVEAEATPRYEMKVKELTSVKTALENTMIEDEYTYKWMGIRYDHYFVLDHEAEMNMVSVRGFEECSFESVEVDEASYNEGEGRFW